MTGVSFKAPQKVKAYLDEILARKSDGGVKFGFGYVSCLELLTQQVELGPIVDIDAKRSIVERALLRRWLRYSDPSLPMFRRALTTELKHFLAQPLEERAVLLFLHCNPQQLGNRRSFYVLGQRLLIHSSKSIGRRFDIDKLLDDATHLLPKSLNESLLQTSPPQIFTPISVTGKWRSKDEAASTAIKAFDLLRVLLNLTDQYGRFTVRFGGRDRPLASVLPSPIYGIFDKDGNYSSLYYTAELLEYRSRSIDAEQIDGAIELARTFREAPAGKSTAKLLVEILLNYSAALDTSDWRQGFLSLWQCLELATLQTEHSFDMKKVASRVKVIAQHHQLTSDLLDYLRDARNELVHTGRFSKEGALQVNLLKFIVERVINFLASNLRHLPTRSHLEAFYRHASGGDSELTIHREVIDLIRDRRNQKKGPA